MASVALGIGVFAATIQLSKTRSAAALALATSLGTFAHAQAPQPGTGAPGVTTEQIEGELREAMKSAQQAVEERQLPRGRYRNVEKYFRTTLDRLKEQPKP